MMLSKDAIITLALALASTTCTNAFSPNLNAAAVSSRAPNVALSMSKPDGLVSREQFTTSAIAAAFFASISTVVTPTPAYARGRATLEAAYERYTPRVIAGGKFYANDLRQMIEKNDWKGIEAATAEPPKKSKADRVKVDGGLAERAAQAGGFSDARVLAAADLFAATFSDNSISPKTKSMKEKVAKVREVVNDLHSVARQALGEEKPEGGLFGLGAKAPSQYELAQSARKLYLEGGTAWNEYIFAANKDLEIKLAKLPYL